MTACKQGCHLVADKTLVSDSLLLLLISLFFLPLSLCSASVHSLSLSLLLLHLHFHSHILSLSLFRARLLQSAGHDSQYAPIVCLLRFSRIFHCASRQKFAQCILTLCLCFTKRMLWLCHDFRDKRCTAVSKLGNIFDRCHKTTVLPMLELKRNCCAHPAITFHPNVSN